MKRWITFAVSFLLVLTVGCRNENEPSLNASAPSFRGSVSEPAALDVSDLHDILATVLFRFKAVIRSEKTVNDISDIALFGGIITAIPLFIRKGAIHHTNNCSDCRKHSLITLQLRKRIENYHHSALCLSRSSVKRIISSTHPSMPSIAESRDSE